MSPTQSWFLGVGGWFILCCLGVGLFAVLGGAVNMFRHPKESRKEGFVIGALGGAMGAIGLFVILGVILLMGALAVSFLQPLFVAAPPPAGGGDGSVYVPGDNDSGGSGAAPYACPSGESAFLLAGKPHRFLLQPGITHVNSAIPNGNAGIEVNRLIKYEGAPVWVQQPEGAAWWYCEPLGLEEIWRRASRDSLNDYWTSDMPAWLSGIPGVTVLEPPASLNRPPSNLSISQMPAETGQLPNPGVTISETVPDVPQAAKLLNTYQGENQDVTLKSGYCYHLNLWWPGDSTEYNSVVCPDRDKQFHFNGTVLEFSALPSRDNIEGTKGVFPPDLAKVPELQDVVTQYQLDQLP